MCRGDGVDRIDEVDGVEGDDRGVSGDWTGASKEGEGGGGGDDTGSNKQTRTP